MSPNPRAFGHAGNGGSLGMADPDAQVGFGFVTNQVRSGPQAFTDALALIDSFYEVLG